MGKFIKLASAALIAVSLTSFAQQATPELEDGFISDELFIYMHSGAGNNYRIVGSINAGSQVKLTGEKLNGYTQIVDDKDRTAWVEDRYVSNKPGLRHVVAELNGQLASTGEQEAQFRTQIAESKKLLTAAQSQNTELTNKITSLESELASAQAKLETQDMDVMKEWFFNGGIVAGLGLLAGLFLPQLFGRRKSSMDSWK
ncbi:TIGR04211 family SH3 domain-containing protein [Thalassotalea montiporae]